MSEIEFVVSFGEHPDIDDCGALREKVVRCRDCAKWHYFDYKDGVRYGECDEWRRADSCCVPATREDGFCYLAKLKEWRRMTNYEKLFGTPEMVVQTLATQNFACDVWCTCLRCPFGESVCPENLPRSEDNEQKMLEWLESEARDD